MISQGLLPPDLLEQAVMEQYVPSRQGGALKLRQVIRGARLGRRLQ